MRNLVADYWRAMSVGAGGAPARYPSAMTSVMRARTKYGIGPRLHSLFRLMDVPEQRWADYLIDEKLRVILREINPPEVREVVNDKLAFDQHCKKHHISAIPILCVLQGRPHEPTFSDLCVRNGEEWADRIDNVPELSRLFFKLVNGTWGVDAFVAHYLDGEWHYCGNKGSAAALYEFALKRLNGRKGWLVQPVIESHRVLKEGGACDALATIRAITCVAAPGDGLLFAMLRIPTGNNITDNFSHGKKGNLVAPIDIETGELGVCRGSSRTEWPTITEIDFHPDSGGRIQGMKVPHWDEVKELVSAGQKSLGQLRTLAWDVAITDDGPVVVEANATYDVSGMQVAQSRGLKSELLRFIF